MSAAQMFVKWESLGRDERLKMIRHLIKLAEKAKAEEAKLLADCDMRADANFQLLDALEAEDDARQN